jgi:hypothetical protein
MEQAVITGSGLKYSLHFCAMEAYWGVEEPVHSYMTSVLEVAEWSALSISRSASGENASITCWIGDWLGHEAGLESQITITSSPS